MTVTYLRDTATQAGLKTEFLAVKDIGWHAGRRVFTDLRERAIEILFKLYPWEWMLRENVRPVPADRRRPDGSSRPGRWSSATRRSCRCLTSYSRTARTCSRPASSRSARPTWSSRSTRAKAPTSRSCEDGQTIAETGGDYADGPARLPGVSPLAELRRPVSGCRELDRQRLCLRHGHSRG